MKHISDRGFATGIIVATFNVAVFFFIVYALFPKNLPRLAIAFTATLVGNVTLALWVYFTAKD